MPTKTLTGAGLNYRQREYWDDVYQKVLSSLQAKKKKASAKLLKSSAARIAWHRFKRKYLKVGDRWVARNKAFAADTIGEGGGSFIMYTTADQAREDAIRDCVYQDVLSYIASEGYLKERSCSDMYPVISSIDGNRVTLFIRSFHSDEKVFSPDRKFVVTVRERRLADGASRFEIESVRPAFSPSLAMAGGQIKSLLHATPEFYLHGDHMRSIAAAESLEAYEAVSYTNVKWVGDKSRFDSPEALA